MAVCASDWQRKLAARSGLNKKQASAEVVMASLEDFKASFTEEVLLGGLAGSGLHLESVRNSSEGRCGLGLVVASAVRHLERAPHTQALPSNHTHETALLKSYYNQMAY